MEAKNNIDLFRELSDQMMAEYGRSRQAVENNLPLSPPEKKTRRFGLDEWRECLQLLGTQKLISQELKEYYQELFFEHLIDPENPSPSVAANQKLDYRRIAQKFTSGARICLIPFPVNEAGLPASIDDVKSLDFVRRLELAEDGLTTGFTSYSAYYSHFFPQEIIDQCTVQVPVYEHYDYPSFQEVKALRESVFSALKNLEKLIE